MLLSRSLRRAAGDAVARLTTDHRRPPNRSMILVVENRDEFFANLALSLASAGFCVQRAASADEATQRLRDGLPDLILANCELPDESGWLMVSKWCLSKMPKRVWLYQAWPAAFDLHWVEFTKVEELLYHGGDVSALADQIRSQLPSDRRPLRQAASRKSRLSR